MVCNSTLSKDLEKGMAPFQRSFARLGEMYFAETHQRLEFYPVAIHPKGYVIVGKPLVFNPFNPVGMERSRLKDLMEDSVRTIFLQVENDLVSEVPGLTFQQK